MRKKTKVALAVSDPSFDFFSKGKCIDWGGVGG